ncbi:multicopper oxidase family protein [Acidocella sp.]|uniref:multicopper oxidase family protein n=1 Tax=Acidocella sp. TaxID=50710 RepID=UPI002632991C|nr:multicopper oxidase domain-containing protein [Acidocella sp.]
MKPAIHRRDFLLAGGMAALPLAASAAPAPVPLTVTKRSLKVHGRAASVYGLTGPDGRAGLTLGPASPFSVMVKNQCGVPTIIHWHGQTPSAAQDGVVETGYAGPIADGASRSYDFTPRPGTYWMHSHLGLQEQALMAAPLIIHSSENGDSAQDIVVLLHDFIFDDPEEILSNLQRRGGGSMQGMMGQGAAGMMGGGMGGTMPGMDLNDIDFDAYLANDRTLSDPEIVRAKAGDPLRLRLINGATATAFWIDLGGLEGQLVAVDGDPVQPLTVRKFPLAGAQRADILLRLPASGAFPIFAQREGGRARTGIVLATPGSEIPKFAEAADTLCPPCGWQLEARLAAARPLAPRPPQRQYQTRLTGSMMGYDWGIDGRQWADRQPLTVSGGERVTINIVNDTMMSHPMHLHGHRFQVVALNGTPIAGAMRDTVLVLPRASVRIAFDADNPGRWLFHCHNLYHMAAGMMTELIYS